MANQPSREKRIFSVQMPIRVLKKLEKLEKMTGLNRNVLINSIVDDATSSIILTDEELAQINEEIIKGDRRGKKARKS